MKSLIHYLKHLNEVGVILLGRFGGWLPDKVYLKAKFPLVMGYPLDLKNPKTFAEKLQWLKLYDRKPVYHQMVDKVESKQLLDDIIGKGYTIPTLGVYDSFEQIDWATLPQQFILKATHDSGSYFIIKDKNTIDKQKCKKQLYIHWNKDYYKGHREWQYKGLKHRIIAEPLIANPKDLREYKFFCFNGEPKIYQICLDRDRSLGGSIVQCVGLDGSLLDMVEASYNRRTSDNNVFNPQNKEKMIKISEMLSKDIPFLRVDFFETVDAFYVGELTLHENAGFCSFTPDHWNYTLGEWIHLPIDK